MMYLLAVALACPPPQFYSIDLVFTSRGSVVGIGSRFAPATARAQT